MTAIPRLIAGTAVCLAAILTAAPVTAGIADFVLNPGQSPAKRAAPQALTGAQIPLTDTTVRTRSEDRTRTDDGSRAEDRSPETQNTPVAESTGDIWSTGDVGQSTELIVSAAETTTGLVARTAADAQSRVSDLAADLQTGVEAGEFSQAEANRVLGDLSSYIKGERTWPERTAA